jgi:hypothetical protein
MNAAIARSSSMIANTRWMFEERREKPAMNRDEVGAQLRATT